MQRDTLDVGFNPNKQNLNKKNTNLSVMYPNLHETDLDLSEIDPKSITKRGGINQVTSTIKGMFEEKKSHQLGFYNNLQQYGKKIANSDAHDNTDPDNQTSSIKHSAKRESSLPNVKVLKKAAITHLKPTSIVEQPTEKNEDIRDDISNFEEKEDYVKKKYFFGKHTRNSGSSKGTSISKHTKKNEDLKLPSPRQKRQQNAVHGSIMSIKKTRSRYNENQKTPENGSHVNNNRSFNIHRNEDKSLPPQKMSRTSIF